MKYKLIFLFYLVQNSFLFSQQFLEKKDLHSNQTFSYERIVKKLNGIPITDKDVDGVLVIKNGSSYYSRVYDGIINVRWFGAKGDGVTDDTQAIQKAIDVVSNLYPLQNISGGNWQGGGAIFFPKGKYIISRTLLIRDCISLTGESRSATQIHCVSPIIAISNIVGQRGQDTLMSNSFSIRNFLISQGSLELQGAYHSEVQYCTIMNLFGKAPNGIIIRLSVGLKISDTKIFNASGSGILFEDTAGSGPSTTVLFDNVLVSHSNIGMTMNGSSGGSHAITTSNISNSIFEYNKTGLVLKGNIYNVSFRNIHFEQNKNSSLDISGNFDNVIFDNVWCDNVGGLKIDGPSTSSIKVSNSKCVLNKGNFKGKILN
ncbi:glycosyl hydrolase family 28-related protein [Chryseobacterium sp.]|uniref:glycosyl hydrolase family 28-related protein n=1 Tax=Chryseobacterium sp. TaxID=1871047 RepID=UPI0012A9141E|nr:glycosyl hydrolase family 28-related protein [Chryseobacterium sp.]QFG53716.1 hypothetical protein F7R58_09175 [Chryseobacterium sp.]